jgi:uncharacterized membrane protein YtjA (UPF0391 family)
LPIVLCYRELAELKRKENAMLTTLAVGVLAQALPGGLVSLAVVFFIIAIVAYLLGAKGLAGMSASIGRTLLFVFLILAILVTVIALVRH